MRIILSLFLGLLFSVSALASSADISTFLNTFPDKMQCDGIETAAITRTREALAGKITVSITGKDSDRPMIEVSAPSSKDGKHFKIGNGFGASLEASGSYSYLFDPSKKVLYYLPVMFDGDPVSYETVFNMRDAGELFYFSSQAICFGGYQCFELKNCSAVVGESK